MPSEGFWVCLSTKHPAILEIIAADDYEKYQETEGGYEKLRFSSTRSGAIEMVQEILGHAYRIDPEGKHLKETILKLYP